MDLPGVATANLVQMFDQQQVITRADNSRTYKKGRKKTGFDIGSGSTVKLRVYDKATEVKSQPDKAQVLVERRWGGEVQEEATRVEFQLRRRWLTKRFEIRTVADWREKRAAVVEYLTHEWFRLTDEPVDYENKHQSRAKLAEVWKEVQRLFRETFGENLDAWLPPITRAPKNAEPVLIQAAGCLSSVLALLGASFEMGTVSALREVVGLLEPHLERIQEETERKRKAFAFSHAIGPPIPISECPF